ncbi:MAG TPA: sigma-70 family RNA polymerase sigma factor [Acidimicrobiales bacterium]|nr:sigma-70 family RNA polymerase sigma factor [Acidimicrobiales bacterium]
MGRTSRVPTSSGGGEARFRILYRDHWNAIYAYVVRRVANDRGEVEDMVADVFEVAWKKLNEIPPPPEDIYWLYRVAHNMVARRHRKSFRQRNAMDRFLSQPADWTPPVTYSSFDDSGFDLTGIGLGSFDPERLHSLLASLPETESEALRLVHWEQLSVMEAAIILDCTPNAVSIRLNRARAKLRSHLEDRAG